MTVPTKSATLTTFEKIIKRKNAKGSTAHSNGTHLTRQPERSPEPRYRVIVANTNPSTLHFLLFFFCFFWVASLQTKIKMTSPVYQLHIRSLPFPVPLRKSDGTSLNNNLSSQRTKRFIRKPEFAIRRRGTSRRVQDKGVKKCPLRLATFVDRLLTESSNRLAAESGCRYHSCYPQTNTHKHRHERLPSGSAAALTKL